MCPCTSAAHKCLSARECFPSFVRARCALVELEKLLLLVAGLMLYAVTGTCDTVKLIDLLMVLPAPCSYDCLPVLAPAGETQLGGR